MLWMSFYLKYFLRSMCEIFPEACSFFPNRHHVTARGVNMSDLKYRILLPLPYLGETSRRSRSTGTLLYHSYPPYS